MTHQNHQTNGASLEDCHTNFFALTELYGIKWRKLVWGETNGGGDGEEGGAPLADPVISSYARCLAGDILCVWRRVPAPPPPDNIYEMSTPVPPPLSLRAAKELWIFWYGEEPDLNGLVAPELIASQGDQGSWESGLSYECRSLLFKALHNLIERCLLSRDFVRLGKWFVQPYDGDEEEVGKSPWHLSFSFAFFLHGESTVCASVDVRQHPPVRTLTAKRLAKINSPDNQADAKVILAPFGLEGTLTGREWSDADAGTARLLDAWRQLYPLEQGCGAVEVVCGGARMRYPCPYVLVTHMEAGAGPARPSAAPARTLAALTTPAPHKAPEICYGEAAGDKTEDFIDPTRKTPCTCAKWRRRRAGRPAPFHRRAARPPRPAHSAHSAHPAHSAHSAHAAQGPGAACSPASCGGGSPAPGGSAPPSAGAPPPSPHHQPLPNHQSTGIVPTTLHTPAPTPDPHAPPTPAPPSLPPPKTYTQQGSPGCVWRRPTLPAPAPRTDPLEDEHALHMLYDYTTVHAWLEHPVKRFKSSQSSFREEMALGAGAAGDLYAGHDHTKMAAMRDSQLDLKHEKLDHNEDTKEYKNLFTSDGLCPTLKDLEQIFDNSDDAASGDETVATPPDSTKCGEESRCGRGCPRAEELSKMFPTPPSMEAHAQASPGFSLPDDATPLRAGSPPPDQAIEDWSYVFKPPTLYKYVGSSKYAPLTSLPSQLLPPVTLPPHAVYRPRYQDHDHDRDTPKARDDADADAARPQPGVKRSAPPTPETRDARPRRPCDTAPAGTGPGPRTGTTTTSTSCVAVSRTSRRGPDSAPAAPHAACPLMLNVLLADTVLNVFRDHNFDSCTLCVCNAGPKVVGNIRGADAATYLSGCTGMGGSGGAGGASPASADDEPSHCTCGFSAILNRRRAHRAGLFYEDEMEITGLAEEPGLGSQGAGLGEVARVVLAHSAGPAGGPASALARAATAAATHPPTDELRLNLLEYTDGGTAAARALRASVSGSSLSPLAAPPAAPPAVHRWPFIGARAPRSSRDVVRLMRRLRPLLQDAIQKRCCGARMWDGVTGPLTWRQFHRLAGRGNEDLCEPQPVPPLLVGHDRDWISLSPYALRHWERLALEPYSYARDVAYVVLAADCDALTEPLRAFFRELSAAYEACRLGRHQPISRLARDGLVRCAPSSRPERDDWTGPLPSGRLAAHLRAYGDTLRSSLLPQLAALSLDKTLLEPAERAERTEAMRPPSTPEHPATPGGAGGNTDTEAEPAAGGAAPGAAANAAAWDSDEAGAPALVLYVVEPPAAHAHRPHALHALLRLAARVMDHLHHHNPLVKIISLESVCARWGLGCNTEATSVGSTASAGGGGGAGGAADVRALAFSVFSGARRLLQHHANGKSLTGFGTAADANLFLQGKDEKNREPYKLFSPAWVLAAPRALKEVAETWGQGGGEQGGVLFLAYCLSHDQRWLLAAATDARGELLDTAAINIHVPHSSNSSRSRRRRSGPARRLGLTKLMDFTLGVMSQAAQPWRLVVGRVGRIGHGELKGWSWLLSRKHLVRASATLREICSSCTVLYPGGVPCILSACLVSTEPDSCLRLMADRFTPDERFSQASIQSHLHTPRDVTATHILVFPTSATTQSNQMPFEPPMANGEDSDMMFLNVDMGDEDMGEDNMTDLLIGDMFNNMWAAGSPRRTDDDPAGSPQAHHHHQAAFHHQDDNTTEAVGALLQQPLALGYMVSTAPLGAMPAWWWAGCAHLRDACPAFLKTALHLHAGSLQAADDYTSLTQRRDHNTHPLDSQTTTDVLRYVLEGYNALSWLALDGNTHDRLSCLPLHVQVLMQLYHTAAALG
ncbi:mediator of RNA polymerase II transcription subunit 13 isoform X6 [Spodoptera frugiperda]|uniref:Mediator of RNA polymerase II transcription subunit 13 n=1 Tax=Spodoptera frugiperda TaxID=7108 RepID=A0A9R0E5L4_SPOFR|nr:mediator of RNA polymerase II transcription subunit 13 isoform X6 [Spodoptera frugiperda]